MAFLGMAGWETSAILKGMPGLLSLAAAGKMDLGRAADITSNIMSAFNIEAEKAGFVADVLAHASANANTNVEQMGEAMKYIAPTASTLGISIEDTSAAIMAFGDAGIQGGMAGRAFGTSLLRLADPSEKIAKEMDKLKVSFFDAEGSMKSLPDIIEQLENGMKGYTDQQRAASLSVLFGAEAQRHWSILLDQGSRSLRKNSEELSNSEGAAKQMADTMMDNAHGAMVEFKSAAEGIGIAFAEHMIPTVTNFINKGTELVRQFGELDDSTQKNIIKMGLFAAAIGPTALVVGNLTTAVGGLFRAGSNVAGMLAGSTGLIARIGAMGATGGPVLLAAAGVGFLSYKMIDAYREANKLYDVSTKLADEMYEQYEANTVLIDSFDELRKKSKLTNEQFADYLDLQTRIANETDPEKIEVMQQEMEMLQKYSGLSNEELEKMVKYNNDVVEALPEATTQITEQGNRVADTTDKLRDYNEEVRRMASRELEQQFYKALSNDRKLREQIAEAQREYNTLVEYEEMLRDTILGLNSQSLESLEENLRLEAEKIEQSLTSLDLTEEEYNLRLDELELIKTLLQNMELGEEHLRSHLANIMQQVDEQKEFVNEKEKELNKINEIVERMAEQQLIAAGISDEQARQLINDGKTIDFINERIKKLQDEKRELDSKYTLEERSTEEYREQAENINKQIGRLKTAKSNIQDLTRTARTYNDELGKQVEKRVGIYTNPSIESLNSLLARPINKQIRMQGHDFYAAYATGTNHHPGGPFIAGEEGWELGRYRDRWEVLNFGLYNRPQGYQVFTHDESKRILRQLNNIPAYAGGTGGSPSAFTDKSTVINNDNHIVINATIRDEHDIDKLTKKLDATLSNLSDRRRAAFGG